MKFVLGRVENIVGKREKKNSKVFQGGEKWGLFGGGPVTLYLDEKLLNFLVQENRVKFGQLPV